MSTVCKNASAGLQGGGLLLAALLCAPPACSSSPGIKGGSGSGGSGATVGAGGFNGSGGTGGGSSCASATPCGGDISGTWNVTSCLTVSGGTLNTSGFLGCASTPISGGSLKVTGTFAATSEGTYSDNTVTSGTEQFTLDKGCLVYSSTPITCTDAQALLKGLGRPRQT